MKSYKAVFQLKCEEEFQAENMRNAKKEAEEIGGELLELIEGTSASWKIRELKEKK